MSRDDGSGAGNVMLAFLLGAVSGAVLALLYAPASGSETRRYLGEKAREGRDLASEAVQRSQQAFQQVRTREHV